MRIKCPQCSEGYETNIVIRATCPACGHDLFKGQEYASTKLYSNQAGFDPGTSYEDFLSQAEKLGWQRALEGRGDLTEWVASKSRANGLYLTKINEDSVVLDYGCGFGNLSFAASNLAREVVSLDVSPVFIRGLNIRRKQDEVTNIFPIVSDYANFPFFENTFDLILVSGVLEYIPCQHLSRPQMEMVRDFIKALIRVLKPKGQIYLAVENRYGLNYILGGRDEHTNLRFVTVLPRRLSEIYSKHSRGLPYREWTYSYKDLTRLFTKSIDFHQQFYAALPEYRHPEVFVSLDNSYLLHLFFKSIKGTTGSLKRRIAIRLAKQGSQIGLTKLRLLKKLVPCFVCIFTKLDSPIQNRKETEPTWLSGQLQHRSNILLRKGQNSLNAIILKKDHSQPCTKVRFTANNLLVDRERKILTYLKSLQNEEIDKWLNYPYAETDFGGGKAVYYSWLECTKRKVSNKEARQFLSILSVVPLPDFLNFDQHDRFIARRLNELTKDNQEMGQWYLDWVSEEECRGTLKIVHGDFHPRNFLCADRGSKIIDWEYVHRGTPLEDWLWFLISSEKNFHFSRLHSFLKNLHKDKNAIASEFHVRQVDIVAALLSVALRLIDLHLLKINDLIGLFNELV